MRLERYKNFNVPAVEGHMNALFEEPSNKTGADATAVCSQRDPLYRIGTAPRVQFDKRNEMIVQVKFKIHAEKEVEVDNPPAIKVRGRKAAPASVVRYNLIESKMFNSGNVIDLVKCLFGKSLNDFKGMCGDICEQYEPGMRHMVLNSEIAPRLRWMGQVGREKVFLVDYPTWQTFVDLLAKATKHKGSVTIFTENEKEKARKVAQTCAAKELIASASGPTAAEAHVGVLTKELEDAHKRIALHELTAKLFHDQSQNGTSGDGAVLVCPWDPSFLYRSTWHGAWVWAKGIQSGMATRDIPPRTYEYLAIMKKSRVFHKATQVNDRVKMRSSQLQVNLSPTFHKSGASRHSFFESPARLLFQKPSGSKRGGSFDGGMPSETDKKKVKIEPVSPSKISKGFTIVISSDPPSPIKHELSPNEKFQIKQEPVSPSDLGKPLTIVLSSDHDLPTEMALPQESKKINQNEAASSFCSLFGNGQTSFTSTTPRSDTEDIAQPHASALERFLLDCNVPQNDETTRMILERAGVKSWTDLIPSVQFTESSLTARGMHPALASHLLSEAMDRVNELKTEVDELQDEDESVHSLSTTNEGPGSGPGSIEY